MVVEDPIAVAQAWLDEARGVVTEPQAMTLATATPGGQPSARVVLLRGLDDRGLVFFTNRESRKGQELRRNPRAAVVLHWWELGRQLRVEGVVEEVSEEESVAYWETRPRGSQVAAWASRQSHELADRSELDARVAEAAERFADTAVPLPPFWGGYRVVPEAVELWQGRSHRMHDRLRYTAAPMAGGWHVERLAP